MPENSFTDFVQSHKSLVYGGAIVLILVVAGEFMKKQTGIPVSTQAGDLSGLSNGIVYVPTQTSFTTENIGADFSNDPNLTSIKTGNITTNSPTSTTTTSTTQRGSKPPGGEKPPTHKPPVKPPVHKTAKSLKWEQRYTIRGGETLSSIAASLTRQLRAQGMPGSMSLTWHDLYSHNTQIINATSAAHHNPIPGGPWNDIFPGEMITVPRWA
jgi:hypothetical protein